MKSKQLEVSLENSLYVFVLNLKNLLIYRIHKVRLAGKLIVYW